LDWDRNFIPKKFSGIDSERFLLFCGRKCSFRGILRSTEKLIPNSLHLSLPRNGSERNSESFLFRVTARIPSEQKTNCFVYSVFRGIMFLLEIPNSTITMESPPLPVMRDFGHDGWFFLHLLFKSAENTISLQLSSSRHGGQAVQSGKSDSTDRPSQYKSHLLGHLPPAKLRR
jgi:hypothetical protein